MFQYIVCVLICFVCVSSRQLYEGSKCVGDSDGVNGTCVQLRRCLSTVYDIKTKQWPQICTYKGREPIICCTDCELVNDTSNVLVDRDGYNYFKTGRKADDKCLEHLMRLDYPCPLRQGVKRELLPGDKCHSYNRPFVAAAVGGVNANKGEFPHMHSGAIFSECLEYLVSLDYPCASLSGLQRELRRDMNCYTYETKVAVAAVGGVDAKIGEFPHMALLGYGDDLPTAQWLCGGSVISDLFILTAAHCISSAALGSVRFVALGILKRSDPPEQWQRYSVRRVVTHPQYRAPKKYHDIALLEVDQKIKFGRLVLPACLNTGVSGQYPATATGWGALGHRQNLADTLQVVTLQPFTREECTAAYPPHRHMPNGYDHTTQACYGDKNEIIDTCEGDSGGPLQETSRHGSCVYKIIGVTSFGRACGFQNNSGMYTRVSYYVPWIESVVWP